VEYGRPPFQHRATHNSREPTPLRFASRPHPFRHPFGCTLGVHLVCAPNRVEGKALKGPGIFDRPRPPGFDFGAILAGAGRAAQLEAVRRRPERGGSPGVSVIAKGTWRFKCEAVAPAQTPQAPEHREIKERP